MRTMEFNEKKYITNNEDGIYGVDLCPISNTIRFTAKCDGIIYAYVVGDFNNWKKSDKYKLGWQVDVNDGILKMMKEIKFDNGLKNGEYRYKYILIDCNGNEHWIDSENGEKNSFSFVWKNVNDVLKIYTSNNVVTKFSPIELVAIAIGLYGKVSFPEIVWSLQNEVKGIYIKNGYLFVDNTVNEGEEIIVNAHTKDKRLFTSKKIIASKKDYQGTLVHFYIEDNNYQGNDFIWNVWSYGKNNNGKEFNFDINTDFGVAVYAPNENIIIRKKRWGSDWVNYWEEQTNSFDLSSNNKNIYIIAGDGRYYDSLKDAIIISLTNIKYAVMDDKEKIKVHLTSEPFIGIGFDLYINNKKVEDITFITHGKEVVITNLPDDIKANDLVVVTTSNMYNPCIVRMGKYLDKFYYYKDDLGVTFNGDKVSFKLWAPISKKVELLLYKEWNDKIGEEYETFTMGYLSKSGVYEIVLNRSDVENMYYLYKLSFNEVNSNGEIDDRITYVVDPYAYSVGVNGDKGFVLDINDTIAKPYGWKNDVSPKIKSKDDAILYEMHIRDFTIDNTSGVSNALKGTFLGAVQENTYYEDKKNNKIVKTGIDHLVELGITHVHLLPVFDFGSVDERFPNSNNRNWGYDPKNFNVPEGSYSTNPYNPVNRIIEFREMIFKFHNKGISVVMDMVYNHMMSTLNMDNIVPGYYFRTDYLGRYTNGSGCGNEMCTERPMVRKFIVDSCMHWIKDYHIDGIRFDLMELIDIDTVKEIVSKSNKYDKNFLVYGEPWKGGNSPIKNGTYKGSQKNQNFSIFNDTFRDAIRGNNDPSKGYINGNQYNSTINWSIIEGLKGSVYTITSKPNESINYIDAHDNYTIWDQIEKSQNYNVVNGNYRKNIPADSFDSMFVRQNLLGIGILMTAQGIPFIQEGSEILRTKQGDHNSYKSDDFINAIKWSDKIKYIQVFNYYKGLIEIRKELPFFKIGDSEIIKKNINFKFANNDETSGVIISHIDLGKLGQCLVIYNGTSIDSYDVNNDAPKSTLGYWTVLADDKNAYKNGLYTVANNCIPKLRSFSFMILCSGINRI